MVTIKDDKGKEWSFHVDKKLQKFLIDKVKDRITKKDKDYVLLIDGYEGSGKSTFGMQMGKFVDPSLTLDRVCLTADEFKQRILDAKKGQCVIYDEAVTGMSAGNSITRIGKLLKSLMMQMRQQNLFVIVILPSVFELNRYAVLSRARSLFHVYEKKDIMGYWVGYNRSDLRKVYLMGKKTYSYRVKSRFIGRFYGKYTINEEEYRKKKSKALEMIDEEEETLNRYQVHRNHLVRYLKKQKMTAKEIEKIFETCSCRLSASQVARICQK